MDWLVSIFLGLVQGISEFLPISSSGHLAIFQHIFTDMQEPGLLFDVMLHLATLTAVLIAFKQDIADMIKAFVGFFTTEGFYSKSVSIPVPGIY